MIVSRKMFTPFEYLDAVTGHPNILSGNDDVASIEAILEREGYEAVWNFPLDEVEEALEHGQDVVLVDCRVWSEETKQMEHEYRWFEVPFIFMREEK